MLKAQKNQGKCQKNSETNTEYNQQDGINGITVQKEFISLQFAQKIASIFLEKLNMEK